MNTNATTNFIRYSEPTMRSNASQAYSQCLPEPEPNYGYSPEPNYGYGSYYGEQAPLPQQPVQAPVAQPSSSRGQGTAVRRGPGRGRCRRVRWHLSDELDQLGADRLHQRRTGRRTGPGRQSPFGG